MPHEPRYSFHAEQRMAQRAITRADIEGVLRQPINGPLPGDGGHRSCALVTPDPAATPLSTGRPTPVQN